MDFTDFESLFTQTINIIDEDIEFKENHIMAKNNLYPCPECGASFKRPYRLSDHMNTHTGETPHQCKVPGCDKVYHSRNSLRHHVRWFHENNSALYASLLRCPHPNCMMELHSNDSLKKHYQRRHTGQFQFKCQYCDKGFHRETQLQSHVFHHTGIPPLRCQTCNAGFTHRRDLNRHLRGHRKWTCSVDSCRQIFDSSNRLRKHMATDHSSEIVCDICQKTFKNKHAVRMHVLVHMQTLDKPKLHCTYDGCKHFYFHKQNLNHHIRFRHQGNAFECAECGKRLCTKTKLEEHIKTFHTDKKPVQPKKPTGPRKTRKDAGIPQRSMAVKLSGVVIPQEEEKMLLKKEYKTIGDDEDLATKVKTGVRRRSPKSGWCVGCRDECKADSQKVQVPETPEDKLKLERLTPESSAVKCDKASEILQDSFVEDFNELKDTSESTVEHNSPVASPCNLQNSEDGDPEDEVKDSSEPSAEQNSSVASSSDLQNSEDSDSEDEVKDCSEPSASPCNLQNSEDTNNEIEVKHSTEPSAEQNPTVASPCNVNNSEDSDYDDGSDQESNKENVECNTVQSKLEQTQCLNSKNSCTAEDKGKELHRIEDSAMDNIDDHSQNPQKEWRQVYDLKKWLLVMAGMMETTCKEVISPVVSTTSQS